MRSSALALAVLALSSFAVSQTGGQATVLGGYASTWVPGAYAMPNPPLVNTPFVSLDQVPFSPVGASNATAGNVAGATNATLSLTDQPYYGPFAVPMWYGPGEPSEGPEESDEALAPSGRGEPVELGIATFQDSVGVARLMGRESNVQQKASRVYTNQDVAQLADKENQNIGTVRYGGKTERLN